MLPPKLSCQDFLDYVSPLPEYDYVAVDNPDPAWGEFNLINIEYTHLNNTN